MWPTYNNKRYKVNGTELVSQGVVEPVEDGRPPLHGDALEHRQHGIDYVVKWRDPVVRSLIRKIYQSMLLKLFHYNYT